MKGRTKETDVIRSVHRLCRADKKKAKAKHGVYQ